MPNQISGFSLKIVIVFCQKLLQVELPVAENSFFFNFVDNVILGSTTVFHGPTQLSPQSPLTLLLPNILASRYQLSSIVCTLIEVSSVHN